MQVITGLTVVLFVLALASSVWLVNRFRRFNGLVNYAALFITLTTAVLLGSMVYYSWRYWLPGIMLD